MAKREEYPGMLQDKLKKISPENLVSVFVDFYRKSDDFRSGIINMLNDHIDSRELSSMLKVGDSEKIVRVYLSVAHLI